MFSLNLRIVVPPNPQFLSVKVEALPIIPPPHQSSPRTPNVLCNRNIPHLIVRIDIQQLHLHAPLPSRPLNPVHRRSGLDSTCIRRIPQKRRAMPQDVRVLYTLAEERSHECSTKNCSRSEEKSKKQSEMQDINIVEDYLWQ